MRTGKKIEPKPRGRPKSYDREAALAAALGLFTKHGYSATSLDMISDTTGMKRPSLYAAFGPKKAIYRESLRFFQKRLRLRLGGILYGGNRLRVDLVRFFEAVITEYSTVGCATLCTATAEAVEDQDIRGDLRSTILKMDRYLMRRFRLAAESGEFDPEKVEAAGKAVVCLLHSVAIRTRAGIDERTVKETVEEVLSVILSGKLTG